MILRMGEPDFENAWENLMYSDPFCPPFFSKLGIRLEIECHRHREGICEDHSFIIALKGIPLLGMRIAAMAYEGSAAELSAYGHPVTLTQNRTVTISAEAFSELEKELDRLFAQFPGMVFRFRESLGNGELTSLGHRLLASGAEVRPRFTRVIDLQESADSLSASRRRRYKNLIAWGKKNVAVEFMTAQNADADVFEQCHQLHISQAGRETRNGASWDLQLERIRAGEAYAVLGRIGGELVSFGYFAHTRTLALYYSSASRRDLFERAIFHAPLWQSILHAKEIGCRWFEVGGLVFCGVGGAPKKDQISQFKSGFGGTSRAQCDFSYRIPIQSEMSSEPSSPTTVS